MNHVLLAEVALSFLCTVQGVATLGIDFNRTHATNPLWPGHARFHVVWQSVNIALLSIVEIVLIWRQGPYEAERFYLASALAAISPLGFIVAWLGRKVFGGTLSDPNGIPPVPLRMFCRRFSIDLNLAAVVVALMSLAMIVAIY